jgi:uncharacterized membrane protein YfcA
VLGAVIRVFVVPCGTIFRILIAAFLLPLGLRLLARPKPVEQGSHLSLGERSTTAVALGAGLVGGIYAIGGGSRLAPVLVGSEYSVEEVAPAALLSTFVYLMRRRVDLRLNGPHRPTP